MYQTGGRWNRHEKIPTGKGFEDNTGDGVAGCMTWHYSRPSPPPPRNHRPGYHGYRPNQLNDDGSLVTTTTKTTVQTTRKTEIPNRKLTTPSGQRELVEPKDLSIYRTEDVLPAQEYVTTTRTYLPQEVDDNHENIYNLQKYKNGYSTNGYTTRGDSVIGHTPNGYTTRGGTTNGYTTNGYTTRGDVSNGYTKGYLNNGHDSRLTNRYPMKSNLKKDNFESYRSRNLDSYRSKNGYNTNLLVNGNTFRDDSGYHSNRLTTDARNYDGSDLVVRDVSYKPVDNGILHEDTLIDVIEDLHVRGEGEVVSRPSLQQTRYEKTQRTIREKEYPRRELNNFDLEPEEIHQYNMTENDVKDLWRKHRDFKNHRNGQKQAGMYRGMSNREKAAMSAHHYRMHQSQREAAQAWGPPPPRAAQAWDATPPRPPSGRRPQSSRFAEAQRIGPAEKEIRFNSRCDFHSYTPEDAYMDRYEDVQNKIDGWRASSATSRAYDGSNVYRRHQRAMRDQGESRNWHPPAPPSRTKDITLYKPKELRYQVAAPYAEESGPREYSVFTPGTEDVKIRVQCPPSPRAKVTVNVDMDPLLD